MGTDAFRALDPDRIMQAVIQAGFEPTGEFAQLNSLENRVFQVTVEDERRLVLKFYRPGRWERSAIAEEHGFIAELAASGLPVCAPLTLSCGSTIDECGQFFFSAWERARGRIPDEFTDEMLFEAGRCLAVLHAVGQKDSFQNRPRLDADTLIRQPLMRLLESDSIPGDVRDRYAESARAAAEALDASLASMPSHRIHGDFHWGNILYDGKTLRSLDFDDCAVGPAVQDVWMIAPAIDQAGVAQREKLLSGYRSVRPFPEEWLSAIGPLKAGRYVDYAAWVASRLGESAFQSAFPSFGTREYWEAELADLEAVVRDCLPRERVPERIMKEYEEAASLTNKDYFFDLE